MADMNPPSHEVQLPRDPSASPTASAASETYSDTPAVFHSDPQSSQHQPLTLRADAELRALLQAFTTRSNIETLIGRLEATQRKELATVKKDVKALSNRLGAGEASVSALEQQVLAVETQQASQATSTVALQL